jgi:hypothetical protein
MSDAFTTFDNFRGTHAHEEKLRAETMALIEADAAMRMRFSLVEKALSLIFAYTHDHTARSDDELTVQMLGIRIFNAAASSIKLALSGYYQTAFGQVRDIMETGFLIDLFRTSPKKIVEWKNADDKALRDVFAPFKVRDALDKRDGHKEKKRAKQYKILCEYAAHATFRGFRMTMRNGNGELGPFVEEKNLRAWVEEMVLRLGPTAVIYAQLFPKANAEFEAFLQGFGTELVTGMQRAPKRGP